MKIIKTAEALLFENGSLKLMSNEPVSENCSNIVETVQRNYTLYYVIGESHRFRDETISEDCYISGTDN